MSALPLWSSLLFSWALVNGSEYVDYIEGTGLPIILTAGHGGILSPERDRPPAGCWDGEKCLFRHGCGTQSRSKCKTTKANDLYTDGLTVMLRGELCNVAGRCPTTIIGNVNRRVLDFNREIKEACFGLESMENAYMEYYGYLQESKLALNGSGIIFDIHGHGHTISRAELGYTITKTRLNSGDFSMNMSSIRNLLERSPYSMDDILWGTHSLGRYLLLEGYDAIPSPVYPTPGDTSYFSGGYTTKTYGSRDGSTIDAIQIESARAHREMPERVQYAKALAAAIFKFYKKHYTTEDKTTTVSQTTTTALPATSEADTTTFMTTDSEIPTSTTTVPITTGQHLPTTEKSVITDSRSNGSPRFCLNFLIVAMHVCAYHVLSM